MTCAELEDLSKASALDRVTMRVKSILVGVALLLASQTPAAAQAGRYRHCEKAPLRIQEPDDAPLKLLKGTRVCRENLPKDPTSDRAKRWEKGSRLDDAENPFSIGDTAAHGSTWSGAKNVVPLRAIVRNHSSDVIEAFSLTWITYDSEGRLLKKKSVLLNRGPYDSAPMKLKIGKRYTYDLYLDCDDLLPEAGLPEGWTLGVYISAVRFRGGAVWGPGGATEYE